MHGEGLTPEQQRRLQNGDGGGGGNGFGNPGNGGVDHLSAFDAK